MISTTRGILATVLGVALATLPAAAFQWVNVNNEAGVLFDHHKPPVAGGYHIGAGAALLDFDGDGDLDLYLTQVRNADDTAPGCNVLYRNLGNGTFEEVLDAAGAAACTDESWAACSADYDNDGDADLYVTAKGQDRLFRNLLVELGREGFLDETEFAGMGGDDRRNSSCSWGDFDKDGNLDLFVQGYVDVAFFDDPNPPTPPVICQPKNLYHNLGDGTFTDIAADVGVAETGCGLATTWSDYDNDGDVDLFIVNDFGAFHTPNRLFRNDGPDPAGIKPWLFTDVSDSSGFNAVQFGMSITAGDVNRDGWLDYYSSNAGANSLKINNGDGTFYEAAAEAGVNVVDHYSPDPVVNAMSLEECLASIDPTQRVVNISWGADFQDFDNDGHLDLHVVSGWIGAPAEMICGNPAVREDNLTFAGNSTGAFVDVTPQVGGDAPSLHSRALAMGDINADGIMDLYLGNVDGRGIVGKGAGVPATRHWIQVKPTGVLGNRDACGARVELTAGAQGDTQIREVACGNSFLSSGMKAVHYGLGPVDQVDRLVVRFLGDRSIELRDVAVDQQLEVREPYLLINPASSQPTYNIGDTAQLTIELSNPGPDRQQARVKVTATSPSGGQTTLVNGRRVSLDPGAVRTLNRNFSINPLTEPGDWTFTFQLTDDLGELIHQAFLDVTFTASEKASFRRITERKWAAE